MRDASDRSSQTFFPSPQPSPPAGERELVSRRALLQLLVAPPPREHLTALETALARAGGLPAVHPGQTVLLKVNTNSADPAPYSTSPVVVAAVAAHYVERGVRVLVGDRSFWGDPDTRGNLERNGIAPAARRAGAEVVTFEDGEVEWTELPPARLPTWVPPVRVPSLVFSAAAVINLACAKTHFITGVTLGLKNALGFVHADDRRREGNLRTHVRERIHAQYREVHAALPITFTIIDAFLALTSGGPTPSSGDAPTIVKTGRVLASRDAHAVEAEARALLRAHGVPC